MRLRISQTRLAVFNGKQSIVIEKVELIDPNTGAVLREVKPSEGLSELLGQLEIDLQLKIDLTDYSAFKDMAEKNPNLKKLVSNFNLNL